MKKWKVYFDGNFDGGHGGKHAGKEMLVEKTFIWEDEVWHIPAMYACSEGLVIDFCIEVKTGATNEINVSPKIILNKRILHPKEGCMFAWFPKIEDDVENSLEAQWIMEHYNLDQSVEWRLYRVKFLWATKNKPKIKVLQIILKQALTDLKGKQFTTPNIGEKVYLEHPITKNTYELTVTENSQQKMPEMQFHDDNLDFPTNYRMITYKLSPDLSYETFSLCDCQSSDRPREKNKNTDLFLPQASVSVSIIGGAHGPTKIILDDASSQKIHTAYSSLHFEPVDTVEWQAIFREKMREDITVEVTVK